jgi:hypothetical protein
MARGRPAKDGGRGPGHGGAEESRGSWCAEHLVQPFVVYMRRGDWSS